MKAYLIDISNIASLDNLLVFLFVAVIVQFVWIMALTSLLLRTIGIQKLIEKQLLHCRELYVLLSQCSTEIHDKLAEIKKLISDRRNP